MSKEDNGDPLASKNLVTLYDELFGKHLDDEKLVGILKCYLRPKNCKNRRVPLCKEDKFRVKKMPMQRKTDIFLQKVLLHTVKA